MNSKQRRAAKRHPVVGVERGYGPRHALNAQEGREMVPEELPTPPAARETRGGALIGELLRQVREGLGVSPEQIEEIKRDPAGAKALASYAQMGIMLMPGMGGEGGGGKPMGRRGMVPKGEKPVPPERAGQEVFDNAMESLDKAVTPEELKEIYKDYASDPEVENPKSFEEYEQWFKEHGMMWEEAGSAFKEKYTSEEGDIVPHHDTGGDEPHGVVTEDGYKFKKQEDGSWGDGDMSWETYEEMIDSFQGEGIDYQRLDEGGLPEGGGQETLPGGVDWKKWTEHMKELPPEEEPPLPGDYRVPPPRFKRGTKGVRKNPKKVGRPVKIGVEKGYGPRHAANSKEGDDLTKVDTDTVPAMLTPREAVLNRNAAEMAGRGKIEQLNEAGNELAKRGVDLAGGGEDMNNQKQKLQGGDDAVKRNPFPNRGPGGVYPQVPTAGPGVLGQPPDQIGGFGGGLGARDEFGRQFSARNEAGGFGRGHGVPGALGQPDPRGSGPFPSPMGTYPAQVPQPMPAVPPQQWRSMPSSPFYPPGQGLKMAGGESDILGGGDSIYGKSAPVSLTAPEGLGTLVAAIKAEASKQGLNASQIAGLLKAFQGMGGAGGSSGLTVGAGTGNMDAVGAFQGGISEVGYPPLISPNADFSYDRGGWVGPYDPRYNFPTY